MDIIVNNRIIKAVTQDEHQAAIEQLQRQLRIADAENNVLRKKLNSIATISNY